MKKLLILMVLFPLVCFGQTRPHWLQLQEAPLVDVRLFGAIGDGVANDTQAIKDAIAHVSTRDDTDIVYFPKGTYRFLDTGHPIGDVKLWGEGSLVGDSQSPFLLSGSIDVRGLSFSGFSNVFYNGVATGSIGDIYVEQVKADSIHTFINFDLGFSGGPGGGYDSLVVKDSEFTNWNRVFFLSIGQAKHTSFDNVRFVQWPDWVPGDAFPGDLQPNDGVITGQDGSAWAIRFRNQTGSGSDGDFFVTNCVFRNILRNSDSTSGGRATGILVESPESLFISNNHFENLIGLFPTFADSGSQTSYTSGQGAIYGRSNGSAIVSNNTIVNVAGAGINLKGGAGYKHSHIKGNTLINELSLGNRAAYSRQEHVLIKDNFIRGWTIGVRWDPVVPPSSSVIQTRVESNTIIEGVMRINSRDNLVINNNSLLLATSTPQYMFVLGYSDDTAGKNISITNNRFVGSVDGDNKAAIYLGSVGSGDSYHKLRINGNTFDIGNDGAAVDWVMRTGSSTGGSSVQGSHFPAEFKNNTFYGGGELFTDRGTQKFIIVGGNTVNSRPFTFTTAAKAYFNGLESSGVASWTFYFDEP